MPWYHVFWVEQMHNHPEKESSPYYRYKNWNAKRWSAQGRSARTGPQIPLALILCSFYQTKLPFCIVSIQQETLGLMADRDVRIPTYIAKSIEARNFTQCFLLENQTCFISFFFTIYLNISHIQNRYNLIFFCLSEKQGFFGTMGEDENETGKEQMLNLKKRTMLGKWSAYFYSGIRCKLVMQNQMERNTIQLSTEEYLLKFF